MWERWWDWWTKAAFHWALYAGAWEIFFFVHLRIHRETICFLYAWSFSDQDRLHPEPVHHRVTYRDNYEHSHLWSVLSQENIDVFEIWKAKRVPETKGEHANTIWERTTLSWIPSLVSLQHGFWPFCCQVTVLCSYKPSGWWGGQSVRMYRQVWITELKNQLLLRYNTIVVLYAWSEWYIRTKDKCTVDCVTGLVFCDADELIKHGWK